jgi:aldose 1-epimerase
MSGQARPIAPSRVLRLTAGAASVTIDLERGGRLAAWSIAGRELLVGPPAPGDASIGWGCFLMAPWAGRLAGGRFEAADGQVVRVPRTHGRHAIHGLLWDRAWAVVGADPRSASLRCDIPAELWPPGGVVRHAIRLSEDRLQLELALTAGAGPAGPGRGTGLPAALGWHPWFRRDAGRGEPALLVDADEVLETVGMIPTGESTPVDGPTDLRAGPRLGRRRLDHAYVAARSPAAIRWPDLELEISWDPSPAAVVVYTPVSSICVEPQTAWPNAPNLTDRARARSGLRALRPGESLVASMSIQVRPRNPAKDAARRGERR